MPFCSRMLLFLGLWIGCIGISPLYPGEPAAEDVKTWILTLKKNPDDMQALKNLGAYSFEKGNAKIAAQCWIRVYRKHPSDPGALYYLGRLFELRDRKDHALQMYARYGDIPKSSVYRDRMEGRHRLLSRQAVIDEMQGLLRQENQLSSSPPLPENVAVFPFQYHGSNPQLSPLGKGLAEMMMTDLSQLREIKVVERLRVQSLVDEARLGQSGLVQAERAPLLGRLLRAGKMVYGRFNMPDQKNIVIDVAYADAVQPNVQEPFQMKDALANLFLMEKDAVFKIIDQMGITPTPQEMQRIQHVPTKNLTAFVLYCMGLEMEDRGEFARSSEFYQKALQADPGFSAAGDKVRENKIIAQAETGVVSKEDAVPERPAESGTPVFDLETMVSDRLQAGYENLGSNFLPGKDVRKPFQESHGAESWSWPGQYTQLP